MVTEGVEGLRGGSGYEHTTPPLPEAVTEEKAYNVPNYLEIHDGNALDRHSHMEPDSYDGRCPAGDRAARVRVDTKLITSPTLACSRNGRREARPTHFCENTLLTCRRVRIYFCVWDFAYENSESERG